MLRQFVVATLPLLLGACTSLADMPIGTSLQELQSQFGPPSISCPAHSPHRFVWSQQPMGQYAWGVDVNTQQQLTQVTQVLTDKEFNLLTSGNWNQERVRCHFGPPAEIDRTPYQGVRMLVWSYRYKQSSAWDSMMYVYFGDDGLVKHHHPGPDPLSLREEPDFFSF